MGYHKRKAVRSCMFAQLLSFRSMELDLPNCMYIFQPLILTMSIWLVFVEKTSFYQFFVSIKSIILTYSWYHELMNWWENQGYLRENCTAQKMKFPIKDCFSKCDQIRRKLRIWSLLLKKSLMENFIFCGSVKDGKFPWSLKGLSIESLGYVRVT